MRQVTLTARAVESLVRSGVRGITSILQVCRRKQSTTSKSARQAEAEKQALADKVGRDAAVAAAMTVYRFNR